MSPPEKRQKTDDLTVVIPIRNEQDILEAQLAKISLAFDSMTGGKSWSITFVDNGSEDNSAQIIEKFIQNAENGEYLFLAEPNYGAAVKLGLLSVKTEYAFTLDIDQIDDRFLQACWHLRKSFDIIIGSKRLDERLCDETKFRWFLSWGLNCLIRLFLNYPGSDTHGPKFLNMNRVAEVLSLCESTRGQFDTELVFRSYKLGMKILEAPIYYVNMRAPRVGVIIRVVQNIYGLMRLVKRMRRLQTASQLSLNVVDRQFVDQWTAKQ